MSIEILAPSGSMESVRAAVRCGADAIYLGGKEFSARANATNFTDEELCEAVRYCHLNGVAVHQAINTLATDGQLSEVVKTAKRSAEIGVDAFIIQDLGVASEIRKAVGNIPLHASTQMSIHSEEGVLLAKDLGFSRVVVSRELSFKEIEHLCTLGIEIECFVHGALCMSVSGQCYMSAMIGSRSANRGLCAQSCRLPFSAKKGVDYNALSLKDLSYIEHIRELERIGVASLKIEGRMKRPEYVAGAVTACRKALDGQTPDTDTLKAVFSRSGFTDGYYYNRTGREMFGTRQKEDVVAAEKVLPELRELYKNEIKSREIYFSARIKKNSPVLLSASADGAEFSVSGSIPQSAEKKAIDSEYVSRQLSKLGDTVFSLGGIDCDIDDGLFLPASEINELRRNAVSGLSEELIKSRSSVNSAAVTDFSEAEKIFPTRKTRLFVRKYRQLSKVDITDKDIVIPLSEYDKITDCKENFLLAPPRYITDEKSVKEMLLSAKKNGFGRVYCNNLSHIGLAREVGMEMAGGYGLNITNSSSVGELARMGLSSCELSFELKLTQISAIKRDIPCGIIVYGRLPLMLTRNCPIAAQTGCKNCGGVITDRTGREFPVMCSDRKDFAEIFNCDRLYLADKQSDMKNTDFSVFFFTDETADEVRDILTRYENNETAPTGITRGLYYRGII